jgi:hypothetical protein
LSDSDVKCPYCESNEGCDHILLILDRTFREACGGSKYEEFNEKYHQLYRENEDNPDFDEREIFDELADEYASQADYEEDYDCEGGPGMSSACTMYFVKNLKP